MGEGWKNETSNKGLEGSPDRAELRFRFDGRTDL